MQKMGNAKGTLQERAKLVLTKNDYEQLSQIGLDQKQFTSIIQAVSSSGQILTEQVQYQHTFHI